MKLVYSDKAQPHLQYEEIEHFNTHKLCRGAHENLFMQDRNYLVCIDEDTSKVVGVVCYKETSGYSADHVGLGYVSVAQNYKNKKIATTLLRMLFEKIAVLGKNGLRVGYYEPEGELYLPAVLNSLAQEFNAELI